MRSSIKRSTILVMLFAALTAPVAPSEVSLPDVPRLLAGASRQDVIDYYRGSGRSCLLADLARLVLPAAGDHG